VNRGFKVVFWGIETTLALVAGISEALIYEAYAPDDWAGIGAAFLRAGAMQLGIIVFGLAAVRAAQQGKRSTQFMANVFSLGFSAISAWFVRESALAEKHLNFLQPAYNQPLIIPFWGSIGGQSIDPTLVGAIPFLIWAVNVFAPIILNDGKVIYDETPEEMQARFKREEIEQQHKSKMRQIAGKGWRDTIVGAVTGANGDDEPVESVVAPATVVQPPPAPSVVQPPTVISNGMVSGPPDQDDDGDVEEVEELQPVLATSGVAVNGQNGAHIAPPAGNGFGKAQGNQQPPDRKKLVPSTKPAFVKAMREALSRLIQNHEDTSLFNLGRELGVAPDAIKPVLQQLWQARNDKLRPGQQAPYDALLDGVPLS
jgi:hypothetical protein